MRRVGTDVDTPRWTSGPQSVPYTASEQTLGWAKFGLGIGALALLGQHKFSSGNRGWDYYINAVRAIEEYSPGRVLRTFQISHMLSPFERASLQTRYFSPELLTGLRQGTASRAWLEHVERLTGRDLSTLIERGGFRYEGGRLLFGETGEEVLLKHAGVIRTPTGATPSFQAGYARSLAGGSLTRGIRVPAGVRAAEFETNFASKVLRQQVKYLDAAGVQQAETFMFTGGRSRLQAAGRFLAGYGTSLVERINQLARAPFELPIISGIIKRTPLIKNLHLDVVSSSGLKTLGKVTGKLGLLGTAAYLGYQQLDYYTRESETLDKTIFAEGITAGLATTWTRGQIALSEAAEWLRFHDYREWQARVAPGSTELSTLLAFPLMGAGAGLLYGYGERVAKQMAFRRGGLSLEQSSRAIDVSDEFFKSAIYGREVAAETRALLDQKTISLIEQQTAKKVDGWTGRIIQSLARVSKRGDTLGAIARRFGEITPGRARWMLGAAVGAAVALPFLPGALIPSQRPEELEEIYSGRKKVAIRRGRFWEFGRQPYEGGRIDRYREHWYPRMLARAKEKAIWGENAPSPLKQWYIENFTYKLEQRHYYERPYPVSGAAFENIPFIGPILAATIGRAIKPPVLMHEEEWRRGDGYRTPSLGFGEKVLPGELERGAPISPYGLTGTIGEQAYRMIEMVGLPGFTMTAIKEAITGTQDVFDQEMQLESANRMYGAERAYWDLELGGLAGTCFIKGSKVKTLQGIKEIQEVLIGDQVLSNNGKYKLVTSVLCKKTKKNLINIKAQGMGIDFVCTDNHHIPVLRRHVYNSSSDYCHPKPFKEDNYTVSEIQAKDIKIGDFLLYVIDQTEKDYVIDLKDTGKTYTDDYVYFRASYNFAIAYEWLEKNPQLNRTTRKKLRDIGIPDLIAKEAIRQFRKNIFPQRISRFLPVDEDFAYVLGWYIAEGCSDKNHLNFTMHANEVKYANEILNVFNKLGFNGLLYIKGNTLRLRIYSTALARYFRIFGIKAPNKRIPLEFQRLPRKKLQKLIKGLMLGDGWQPTEKWEGGFTSSSGQLVKDLAQCLLKFGQIPYLNIDYIEKPNGLYPQGSKRKDTKRSYLQIRAGRFFWKHWKSYFLVPITSIKKEDGLLEYVYDLTVEKTHHYTVDGVLVHNSELFRRLYPHRRRQIELYNPIPNQMPSWLPGPGDRSPDFLHGDPYTAVREGEMRLPGPGYAALHPELKGIAPGDYPLINRFAILADIAPYSDKYKSHLAQVRAAVKAKRLSQEEIALYKETMQQVAAKKVGREFVPYQYRERAMTPIEELLAQQTPQEEPDLFEKAVGSTWETMTHAAETPFEFLTPLSPASKLIHQRTAVEDYEKTQLYGCLLPEQLVKTLTGIKQIKDIVSGDYVYTHDATWNRVISMSNKRMLYPDIITIIPRSMVCFPIKTTPDHRLLVADLNETIQYLRADQIKISNHMLVYPLDVSFLGPESKCLYLNQIIDHPRLVYKNNKVKIGSIRQGKLLTCNKGKWICNQIDLNKHFFRLFGYYLAEGSTNKQNGFPYSVNFALHINEEQYADEIIESVYKVFSLKAYKIYRHKKNTLIVEFNSVPVAMLLEKLAGRFAWNKHIPEEMKPAPIKYWIELLKGYFRGDGHCEHTKVDGTRITGVSTSLNLLVQLKDILLLLGWIPCFKIHTKKKKNKEKHPSWSLDLNGNAARDFLSIIENYRDYKHRDGRGQSRVGYIKKGFLYTYIKKIDQDQWDNNVYDLEVEGCPSFSGPTGYIYHNSQSAFWGHPIRDFVNPFITASKRAAGWEGIPEEVQHRRDIEEYFDLLKYVKYTRLKRAAQISNDDQAVKEYEDKRRETLFGINPFTYNFSHILRALPRRERDYFNAFAEADMEERAEIFKMIPENEQALLMARWKLKDAADLQKVIKKGLLSEDQTAKAEAVLQNLYEERETEGLPKTGELWQEYIATRLPGESYPDWYRRVKLLEKELAGRPLPGPDWVGYLPAVDLDDIKLKVVQNEAGNMYNYDLWPDRLRAVARRPFIEEAAEALQEKIDPEDIRARIMNVLSANNITAAHVSLIATQGNPETVVNLQLKEDRTEESRKLIRKGLE